MKEEKEDSLNNQQQVQAEQSQQYAFKDFRNAIPLAEFESILKIARHEYNQLAKVYASRERFIERSNNGLKQIQENANAMPPGLAEKLIEGLRRRADEEVLKSFKGAINRHKHVTDFLNRFQDTDEILPYLEFNKLKLKK